MSRIETREHAMELLFQIGFRNDPISNQIETFKENFPEVIEDEAYFLDIVYGVINSRDELDEKFVPFLKNWKLERLPQTDRIILELATHTCDGTIVISNTRQQHVKQAPGFYRQATTTNFVAWERGLIN